MDLDAAFASLPGLTTRGAQRTMASAVATALEREQPLLVHAPTGVGKSLGYLVPIAAAGRRAIVATATKALQSQLIDRDLPRLADAFQTTSALLMGRGNYVCLAKVDALVAATRLAATAQEEAALQVVDWAVDSDSGSRLDAPPGTRDDVWDLISTPGEDCPGQKGCSFFKRCFAERAKEQARDVDVVVTNHHLLLLELELRQASDSPGVMLPEVDVVVVDEAHRLADHAADLYGVTVTGARVSRAGAAADAIIKASGSTSDWARRLRARWEDRVNGLRPGPVLPGSRAAADLGRALEPVIREALAASAALRGVAAVPDDLEGGMHAARRRLTGLCRDLQRLREVEAPVSAAVAAERSADDPDEAPPAPAVDLAVWIEERRDGGRTIRSALVEPGAVLRDVLWDRIPTTVACSATLAVAGELGGTAAALGVERPDGLVAESPFDFRGNALLYVPRQSLSLLVLDRLPFPRPDDPLLAERGRRIERRGGSKFGEVWLPSAAVSLQQALGRLIRSESDRGVMAVLDRRLADAGYGRRLLVSLPPAPLTRSIQEVRRFFGTDDPTR